MEQVLEPGGNGPPTSMVAKTWEEPSQYCILHLLVGISFSILGYFLVQNDYS